MRKGPLSNKDKEFIEDNLNLSNAELSGKLDRSESSIGQYRTTLATPEKSQEETSTMNLYARNKKYGVVAMTENASISSDDRTKAKNVYETRKYRNSIHKIRD
jgi:hypothetical protein